MAAKTIFVTGAPASGKTTLGRRLAFALGADFADLDEEIVRAANAEKTTSVRQQGVDIPAIFAAEGEAGFRARERAALVALAARADCPRVIALGGGTLLDESNRALCESKGTVLCLETPSEAELARRLGAAAGTRPLGDRAKARAAHYASFPRRIAATFDLGASLVVVGEGIAPALLGDVPSVIDGNILSSWAHFAEMRRPLLVLPSGEEHKTIATVASIWSACAAAGIGRRDVIAAVGGGVTGDLTGFAAATWMRGIDWINVPTTLLAMVDASTGGKTGCDLPEGKNLAGAFHSPRLVIVDTDFLKTLPPAILADGRAEMIKHEIISGTPRGRISPKCASRTGNSNGGRCSSPPFGQFGELPPRELRAPPRQVCDPTASDIAANLAVKIGIVREDPFETTGRRLLLNCGHTVAHAVEKLTDYRVSHGSAVAIGCVEEARLAVRLGLAPASWPDELASVFAAAGLPTALPDGLDFAALRSVMAGDKKRAGDIVTFALPCGWGDVRAVPLDLTEVV